MRKTINIPLFNAKFTFLYGSYDQIKKYIPRECDHEIYQQTHYRGMVDYYISRKTGSNVVMHIIDASHEVINHESCHAANKVLHLAGVKADFENDETQAYLTGWIVDEVYSALEGFYQSQKIPDDYVMLIENKKGKDFAVEIDHARRLMTGDLRIADMGNNEELEKSLISDWYRMKLKEGPFKQ